jgi:hypothetical protein
MNRLQTTPKKPIQNVIIIIIMIFRWLWGWIFRTRTIDFANQLQDFQEELEAYQSQKKRYNTRVRSLPNSVTRFLIIICVLIAISAVIFIGFEREKRQLLYTTLASIVTVHVLVLMGTNRLVRYYYRHNISSTESSMEKLLIKQRNALEKLKKESDYYTTYLLVQKYESSIAEIESQLLNIPNHYLQKQQQIHQQQQRQQQQQQRKKKEYVSTGTQTDVMMNFDTSLFEERSTTERVLSPLRRGHSELLASPVSDLDLDTPTRPRARSLSEVELIPAIMGPDDTDNVQSSDNNRTPRRRSASVKSELETERRLAMQQQKLQQMYIQLKAEISNMEQRRHKMERQERELEQRKKDLIAANKAPVSRNKLYDESFTSRYQKKDVQARNVKSSWLDRLVDKVMGQSPEDCLALICDKCSSHNGLVMFDDGDQIQRFRCWGCGFYNSQLLIHNENTTEQQHQQHSEAPDQQSVHTGSDYEEEISTTAKKETPATTTATTSTATSASPSTMNDIDFDEVVNSEDISSDDDERVAAVTQEFDSLQETDLHAND